jgi:hypothetical protein
MEKMALTEDEIKDLKATRTEPDWYKVCEKIKRRRNGQYPNYLSREILILFQEKFPPQVED